jgi:hypothetical protein
MYVPIRFFWTQCSDNAFSDRWGDTLWISRHVYNFEHVEITDNEFGFPGYLGAPDSCLIGGGPGKPTPIRCVDFTNGGIDIVCADSIDARADINLNGVAYEVADAVLFSMYFVYGIDVFDISVDGQIAATDVNADGVALSVADLVYLIRVVVGDLTGLPKPAPGMVYEADFEVQAGVLSITDTRARIGAVSIVAAGEVVPSLPEEASDMTLQYNFDGVVTRLLVYDPFGEAYLEGGPVVAFDREVEIESVDVGAYDGLIVASRLTTLPTEYRLSQNYPNPFNPSTTFEFALPTRSEWRLTVYNVLGQTVSTFSGESDPGWVKVCWDASSQASGVYFYRLQAGPFTATKKMVLLK